MTDLADFLRARFAERRAIALAAQPGPWHSDGGTVYVKHPTDQVVDYSESADHIATNDPADVLADLDAKLALLDEHGQASLPNGVDLDECRVCGGSNEVWPCPTLRILARPFTGHADYQDKWRSDDTR
ncbi:DUF6221 family protein [Streptomyces badius]|uniref:Uncharacterized protein n=1 Tax=Streptomyces badius TaxID=1941 RepID=A0ABQ2TCX7_STRBA|nr:DUF6221 family protein [Streptomyces badius]GGS63692.1 hypothetical protein GCM10010253_43310 [Streptomyces badius]